MKGSRKVVCGATQTIGLLAFIYLFYNQSFSSDPINFGFGKRNVSKWIATTDEVGVLEDNLQQSFKLLIGDNNSQKLEKRGFACDNSTANSLVCVSSNPVKIDTKSMEIYLPSRGYNSTTKEVVQTIRPYAWRQLDLLQNVTPLKFIINEPSSTRHCDYNHKIPAVVFSSGGFVGNIFHEFNEIIIPLFMTSRLFESQVQFILVDYNPFFVDKFTTILSGLSRYNILNPLVNTSVHCFPGVVVGLKYHKYLGIDSSQIPKGNSMLEFKKFVGETYFLKNINVSNIGSMVRRPMLLLISRKKTRSFLNEDEMVKMMEELGFEVVVVRSNEKMSNLDKFAKLVNKCHVFVGAHGAGMTNQMFLASGAVVVQVVPLGLEWPSTAYYGGPAVGMGLHYLDYKIGVNESSLSELYGRDDPVISDPGSEFAKGYFVGKELYLDKQNIKVDVNRFKVTLIEALRLLGQP